ncbi:cupin domain-containing protein [Actinokineospora sp. G85]|uniref:cupin domain-containing protein n=1 Tax=Actinokineospora sp. G85 TaxID=3406626 RepID=UPI003C72BB16
MAVQGGFDPAKHIQNVYSGAVVNVFEPDGTALPGISGVVGAVEKLESGKEIGADRIVMKPGAEFELHTHPGAHILFVLKSRGHIHIDGVDYEMREGDTVFVPADFAHGVRTIPDNDEALEFVAFGFPHMPLTSTERMTLV